MRLTGDRSIVYDHDDPNHHIIYVRYTFMMRTYTDIACTCAWNASDHITRLIVHVHVWYVPDKGLSHVFVEPE